MTESTDPYLYPGTLVLKNIRDIRDSKTLAQFEAQATSRRLVEMWVSPPLGNFDVTRLKAIHHYLFQDVYDWAGNFRSVNISKDGDPFGPPRFLEGFLESLFRRLDGGRAVRSETIDQFAEQMAFYFAEINAAHPFREGNGRTQREFLRQLAVNAGFVIDWRGVTREEMIVASRQSLRTGDNSLLTKIILSCLATNDNDSE
jgi:cell filamentation protein